MPASTPRPSTPSRSDVDFDTLYETYASYVLHLAGRIVGRQDAPDVAQRVWCAVAKAWARGDFRGDAHVRSWLHSATRNMAFSWLRSNRKHKNGLPVDVALEIPTSAPTPEAQATAAEAHRWLRHAIDSLQPIHQDALLARLDGMTCLEQASAFGIPEATVKTRAHRATQMLREMRA